MVNCAPECNQEILKIRTAELNKNLKEMTCSGETANIMKFMQKLQSIVSGQNDLQAACDTVDDLFDEM